MGTITKAPGGMNAATFSKIREIVYETSGISLNQGKKSLVKARIAKRMKVLGLEDYGAYLSYVLEDKTGAEIQHMLDAISTNTTSFYREADHFSLIREVVREWLDLGRNTLRFWSAASSTGEEPYTLAIELKETIGNKPVTAKILATDISTKALLVAQRGSYPSDRISTVPKYLRTKYFIKRKQESELIFDVRDEVKNMILFRQYNLSNAPYPIPVDLDVILCRNVMIYFDMELRRKLAAECERLLKPGGYLLIGHAESLTGLTTSLERIKPSVYVKV
jgi:chemotaxis protein methyltransferase CheR